MSVAKIYDLVTLRISRGRSLDKRIRVNHFYGILLGQEVTHAPTVSNLGTALLLSTFDNRARERALVA